MRGPYSKIVCCWGRSFFLVVLQLLTVKQDMLEQFHMDDYKYSLVLDVHIRVSFLSRRILKNDIHKYLEQMLASGLHALLQVLDVKEDIFSLGHTARLVATELESYAPARSRRKVMTVSSLSFQLNVCFFLNVI